MMGNAPIENMGNTVEKIDEVATGSAQGKPGDACAKCGRVMGGPVALCPYCGNKFEAKDESNVGERYNLTNK